MRFTVHIIKERGDRFDYVKLIKGFITSRADKPTNRKQLHDCLSDFCERNGFGMLVKYGDVCIYIKTMVTSVQVIDI